jgi:phosphoenolpyruvate-protein kinase (PTS system EI component)
MPRIGAMVEVPSAALCARALAQRCDYFSLGTNDLTQYTLAVDRCNPDTVSLYQPFHPAVLHLVKMAVDAAREAKIGIAACGELAGTPLGAIVFAGLGVRSLSVAPASIPLVKETLRRVPAAEAERIAALAAEASTAAQIRHLARKILSRFAPEILRQC